MNRSGSHNVKLNAAAAAEKDRIVEWRLDAKTCDLRLYWNGMAGRSIIVGMTGP